MVQKKTKRSITSRFPQKSAVSVAILMCACAFFVMYRTSDIYRSPDLFWAHFNCVAYKVNRQTKTAWGAEKGAL